MISPPQGCSSCSRSSCRRRCWGSNWPDPRSCSCSPYQGARRQDCIGIEKNEKMNKTGFEKLENWKILYWLWEIENLETSELVLRNWTIQNWFWNSLHTWAGASCQGHRSTLFAPLDSIWRILPDCYDGITFRSQWSRLSNLDARHLEGNQPGVLPDERPQGAADAEDRHAEEEADSKRR